MDLNLKYLQMEAVRLNRAYNNRIPTVSNGVVNGTKVQQQMNVPQFAPSDDPALQAPVNASNGAKVVQSLNFVDEVQTFDCLLQIDFINVKGYQTTINRYVNFSSVIHFINTINIKNMHPQSTHVTYSVMVKMKCTNDEGKPYYQMQLLDQFNTDYADRLLANVFFDRVKSRMNAIVRNKSFCRQQHNISRMGGVS